ncbi:class I SAM-dependent methyltransferase [Corticibacterium sp. UT-5YL-CI-8]|nr:class I SAM-dependent methyltransferase [Tianweitania sp. UT-5YL-CI-8]
MDVFQRLWTTACAMEEMLAARLEWVDHPTIELEKSFNGGVSSHVGRHYSTILTSGDLPENARILDMGCGFGRIAMALAGRLGPGQRYYGLDPNAEGIGWAQHNISPRYPNFSFERIDIKSKPYNPSGQIEGSTFRFPFDDASLDLVFMISVLTHVDLAIVDTYAKEAARVLKPDTGRLVTTIFLLDHEVDTLLAEGKGSFRMAAPYGASRVENPADPELAIAHPRGMVLDILQSAGFAQTSVFEGHWSGREGSTRMDFQDLVIADRYAGKTHRLPTHPALSAASIDPTLLPIGDKVAELSGGDEQVFSRFVTWSNSVTLNAL